MTAKNAKNANEGRQLINLASFGLLSSNLTSSSLEKPKSANALSACSRRTPRTPSFWQERQREGRSVLGGRRLLGVICVMLGGKLRFWVSCLWCREETKEARRMRRDKRQLSEVKSFGGYAARA